MNVLAELVIMRDPEFVTPDAILNVALSVGIDVERAEQLAEQHKAGADMRDWLSPHMRNYIRSLRQRFDKFDGKESK